jgi:hypothetical protein
MEYVRGKMASSMEPIVRLLIERGNADDSWDCPRPRETAAFILRGVSGKLNSSEQAMECILLQVLGAGQKSRRRIFRRRSPRHRRHRQI